MRRNGKTTTEWVRELAPTGEYKTMTALGAKIGVTRERVRQIIRAERIPWRDPSTRLKWDCPGCGGAISVRRSTWSQWTRMLAHCRPCSIKEQKEFCKRGHLRSESRGNKGQCLPCQNAWNGCTAEVRTCLECGKPLKISRAALRQHRQGQGRGEVHIECYYSSGQRNRRRRVEGAAASITQEN